ncbi:MAG TPA: PDC sensor domain-containing protein [Sulfurimonas sp.]|uniref:PDC sensor domain-containing protein n=1 Tax=Sulfurimonas sp. TaxID=2022749 RepID=UPI002BFD3FD6|nr:PDC sensor domain-containing protein [Sulfurimonas sp.]HUH42016.1 PDC sensor domain-containing protein [Sulfurimonas sp.]
MLISDMQNFSEGRTKARAYFCYLFSKNIQNRLPSPSVESIIPRLLKIKAELENCDGVYLLDNRGVQVSPTFTKNRQIDEDAGRIRSDRAYYYRAVKEGRCTITDPYPSLMTSDLCITASQPVYDDHGELKFVACLDMPLNEVIKISRSSKFDKFFTTFFKYSYAIFSVALVAVALLLFLKGMQSFFVYEISPEHFNIKDVFEATILLTLALAIFDLAKTLIEEEILGRNKENSISGPHKTMVRFLGSIIIALSIEALMLVFKFAITDPEKLLYAMYIIGGVSMLLITLAIYIKFTKLKIDE